ncbi:MAG: hypothetical protein K6A80_00610 [Saccharofermentans sp.]|nr:hypothetical protein [Saccharofermentans sp.]
MDNKYHEIMSHIDVNDEMRERILNNIQSDASLNSNKKAKVTGFNKARISSILGIVAAAGIVLAVGGVFLSKAALSGSKSASTEKKYEDNVEMVTGGVVSDSQSEDSYDFAAETIAPDANAAEEDGTADDRYFLCPGAALAGDTDKLSVTVTKIQYGNKVIFDSVSIQEFVSILNEYDLSEDVDAQVSPDGMVITVFQDRVSHRLTIDGDHIKIDDMVYLIGYDHDTQNDMGSTLSKYFVSH